MDKVYKIFVLNNGALVIDQTFGELEFLSIEDGENEVSTILGDSSGNYVVLPVFRQRKIKSTVKP